MTSKETSLGGSQDDPIVQNGAHAKPTRGPLQDRSASPEKYNTSGMEAAMGQLADKEHQRVKR